MDLLIFDMDGVLLEANGYHRALQRTVQLSAEHLNLKNIHLTQDQIHTFESLGISSEWHSSALCMAFLEIQLCAGTSTPSLDLSQLYSAIQNQPFNLPARQRAGKALREVCAHFGVDYEEVRDRIEESEYIERSPTMAWFQELVLGSQVFLDRYKKDAQLNTPSYLEVHDRPLISNANADLISHWSVNGGLGAAIMTNRPSAGPGEFGGSPEAELGRDLVGLGKIPLIGYGEISWLADQIKIDPDELSKPNPCHALAAIFIALGFPKETSLKASLGDFGVLDQGLIGKLEGKTITVFEDTPAGIRSVTAAGQLLVQQGTEVDIRSIGIASSEVKIAALEAAGARVVSEIDSGLTSLDDFGTLS